MVGVVVVESVGGRGAQVVVRRGEGRRKRQVMEPAAARHLGARLLAEIEEESLEEVSLFS